MGKILFKITSEVVQNIAISKIGRRLTGDELYYIQKGVEFGLEYSWEEVVKAAIDEVARTTNKGRYCNSPQKSD